MSKPKDLTEAYTRPSVDWKLRGKAFASQFDREADVQRGLYVHLDMNDSHLPIYDCNGAGKIIIFGSTMALKFGKFLKGLPARMLLNHDHFHRRNLDGSSDKGIFARVLKSLFVLDLSQSSDSDIRNYETTLRKMLLDELCSREWIHPAHRGRSESINLAHPIPKSEVITIFSSFADRIGR